MTCANCGEVKEILINTPVLINTDVTEIEWIYRNQHDEPQAVCINCIQETAKEARA